MNGKHALGKLIEKVQHENGWTDRKLAERAQSSSYGLGKSNWSRLKNQPVKTFKPEHVKGLALILNQTETAVSRAILESMGIQLEGYQDGDVESAVRNNSELSRRDKNVMLAVFRELAKENHEQSNTEPETNNVHQLRPSSQSVVSSEKSTEGWAAYKPGGKSMKRHQVEKQDTDAEGSQDPDDHKGK